MSQSIHRRHPAQHIWHLGGGYDSRTPSQKQVLGLGYPVSWERALRTRHESPKTCALDLNLETTTEDVETFIRFRGTR